MPLSYLIKCLETVQDVRYFILRFRRPTKQSLRKQSEQLSVCPQLDLQPGVVEAAADGPGDGHSYCHQHADAQIVPEQVVEEYCAMVEEVSAKREVDVTEQPCVDSQLPTQPVS